MKDESAVVLDCRHMLRFARRNGYQLPPALVTLIAGADKQLGARGLRPISDIGIAAEPPPEHVDDWPTAVADLLTLHAELSNVIAPTTALSLASSEPPPGRLHWFFGGMPMMVKVMASLAIVSSVLFVITASKITSPASASASSATPASSPSASASSTKSADPASAPGSSANPASPSSTPASKEKSATPPSANKEKVNA